MLFYKVVEIRQKTAIRGASKTIALQNEINRWAVIGWEFDKIVSGETVGLFGEKDIFLIIFKKQIQIPPDLFFLINNQRIGAIDEYTFRNLMIQKLVNPNTQACTKGMSDWQPLSVIAPEIADAISKTNV